MAGGRVSSPTGKAPDRYVYYPGVERRGDHPDPCVHPYGEKVLFGSRSSAPPSRHSGEKYSLSSQ